MGLFDRLMQPQAAPRRNLMDTQMVRRPSESYLRQDYPMVYGALGGLFGTAPDEMAGSVLDPSTAAVRRGAEYGFPVGTALGMSPLGPVAQRGAMVVGRAGERLAERAVPQIMQRGGLPAQLLDDLSRGTVSPLDVYHGTPHTLPPTPRNPLGEFDASKIGTGEGAQSYGLGIYTAENPNVAKTYQFMEQNWFDTSKAKYKGKSINSWYEQAQKDQERAFRTNNKILEKDANARLAYWENIMTHNHPENVLKQFTDPEYGWDEAANYAKSIDLKKFSGVPRSGNLYKADLPDEKIAQMIDYDKPMAEQRNVIEKMREALVGPDSPLSRSQQFQINDYLNDSVRMRNLYPQSVVDLNDPRIVERLRQVGIPGIKYLDEGSRGAEASKQTRNFVTFPGEEKNLTILERNGQKATRANQSPYPQQGALDLAQQRAALPVSQGGLGLPTGNTAEQRAAAMGFNTDAYHGTNISNITKFDLGKSSRGEGTSVALTPENAQAYGNITYPLKVNQQKIFDPTNKDQFNELKSYVENLIQKQKPYNKDSLSFYPFTSKKVLENLANPQTGSYYLENELISKSLQDLGYSGSIGMESGQSQLKMFDPAQIRSRFAAFDPFRRSAAIAATMGVAAPDLLANELDYPSNPMYTDPLGYSIR